MMKDPPFALLPARNRSFLYFTMAGALLLGTACSQDTTKTRQSNRVVFSSKEFDRGRQDGRRDAKASWFEESGAWTWLWMIGEDYGKGYEQGWTEGRAEVRSKKQQEENSEYRQPPAKAPTEESWNP
ncbi:MAG: hypothetical protein MI923_23665 [Phycisphaerales bacterium]|nr:hypothetical protein [Phycisphaerales bacterium]